MSYLLRIEIAVFMISIDLLNISFIPTGTLSRLALFLEPYASYSWNFSKIIFLGYPTPLQQHLWDVSSEFVSQLSAGFVNSTAVEQKAVDNLSSWLNISCGIIFLWCQKLVLGLRKLNFHIAILIVLLWVNSMFSLQLWDYSTISLPTLIHTPYSFQEFLKLNKIF